MKRSLRLACLFLAFAGGALFWTGEVSAATKKKASRHAATAKPAVDPAVIREAQNALTELGFYFGSVDGELNEETRGALRRFQVYKGLGGSGSINEPTLEALRRASKEAASEPRGSSLSASVRPTATPAPAKTAPEPSPSSPKLEKMENPLAFRAPGTPAGTPSRGPESAAVRPAVPSAPPAAAPSPIAPRETVQVRPEEGPYYPFLRGTPYAAMPLSGQEAAIRSLQAALARERFYQGPIDGAPTAATEEALYRFQSAAGLALSGRLDSPTLQALGLVSSHRAGSASMARGRRAAGPPPTGLPPQPGHAVQAPPAAQTQARTLGPAGKMVVPRGTRRPVPEEPVYQGGRTLYRGGVVRGIPLE